ncbi:MAG: excalibur calcium-binding domain-containing protein [Candidatus Electrothrix gigas]
MEMLNTKQRTGCFLIGFIIGFLLYVPISSATEFYLSVTGGQKAEHCDFLVIQANKARCTQKSLSISYDLRQVRGVALVEKNKSEFFSKLTPGAIEQINSSNQRALEHAENIKKIEQSKVGYLFKKLRNVKSFADLQRLGKRQYQKYGVNGVLHVFLPLVGTLFILAGFLWLLLAALRVHILWGLGCLVLPFMSLFFLFLHGKSAIKPFVVSCVGTLFVYSGIYLFADKKVYLVKQQSGATSLQKKIEEIMKPQKNRFSCQGKKHCSEMTSCAEAKFYLKNCPGVQIDGNNDGVPCERQWCR